MIEIISSVQNFLAGFLLLIILCGTGIYFTIKLKFIQITSFKESVMTLFAKNNNKRKIRAGEMTPLQSLATAIAAQVGTGNLTGAATALIMGGPGAIFWMWLSAFFGMATIYAEATLAQEYKTVEEGEITGGPVYYIRAAFKGKFGKILAGIFAVLIILALGFMGIMVQSNSISSAFVQVFENRGIDFNPLIIGVILILFALPIFFGGVAKLTKVVGKIVPIMAFVYIFASLIVISLNIERLPEAFEMIFVGAFKPSAVLGAGTGIMVKQAIRYGVARGLFSNEAGMGSTPHAHARANAENPHKQGLTAMLSVFIDTFIILNLTVFAILTTGVLESGKSGINLTQLAFSSTFGSFGDLFIAICLLFFAFSTILSWHFFGAINVKYLFGKKSLYIYSIIVLLFVGLGSILKSDLVWELADLFNSLMVIPNAIALLALSGVVYKIYMKYKK